MAAIAYLTSSLCPSCSAGGETAASVPLTARNGVVIAKKPKLDYAAHVAKLRATLPRAGFHIVIQEPFVVVGDESAARVARRARQTVKWASDLLKKDFFADDPDHVIDIWLFKDAKSYQKHTRQIFGQVPTTPFGWYSLGDRALIMNIHTGGGTLVHEIVHPFMAANFADCPAWFNEGMGSLYEQCAEKDGKIMGLTNWRLSGLQKAIAAGAVPTFEALCSTTEHEFYNEDPGTNYAQARYLCYYLQEKGLLRRYYKAFRVASEADPTGYVTLLKILGYAGAEGSGAAAKAGFAKAWAAYVMKLRFP